MKHKTAARQGDLSWRNDPAKEDIAAVRALVRETGMFNEEEVAIAAELVEERLTKGAASGYDFHLLEDGSRLLGYACFGRVSGTLASFDLYWIAVAPGEQGRGLGRLVLDQVEASIGAAGGGQLYADTSSTDKYVPTRAFYLGTGFHEAARLRDFYRPGDDKVIYAKRIA